VVWLVALVLVSACVRSAPEPTFTPIPRPIEPTPTDLAPVTPTTTPPPYPWTDENAVLSGLCFESVYDAAGRVFTLRTPEELNTLFDLADNSRLCRQPVRRAEFDFSGGRVLIGLWSRGRGCDARHVVTDVRRDDVARFFSINVRLVTEGDCNYELVQPFWIGVGGLEGYDIRLIESPASD
jgi:hypothetical protein